MATLPFTAIQQTPVSKQVSEQIKTLIIEGNLKPGDKLPSERELSRSLGVGRLSLREGLRILESMGMIETKYGVKGGSYVSAVGIDDLTRKFSDLLRLGNITIDTLYEARLEIGLISVKFFIKRGNDEDLGKLETCVKEQEALLKRGLRTRGKNLDFHRLLAEGSKNPVFIFIQTALLQVIRQFLSQFENPHQHSKKLLTANKRILKCLKEKDIAGASNAMRNYVLFYNRQNLKALTKKKNSKAENPRGE
jgi:GntR family transcriptional repressor for pyruvate dehydrogenase complex